MKDRFSFSMAPSIKARRTKFDLSFGVKSSLNVGDLAPMYVQEIYPGDTFKVDTSIVARSTNPFVRPVMDNLYLDTYFFFVPSRILYKDWSKVFGESTNAWADSEDYVVPTIPLSSNDSVVNGGSVADYLGLPLTQNRNGVSVNVLPFRAFAKIYDVWFRDENLIDPMLIQDGGPSTIQRDAEKLNSNPWAPNNYTGMLPKVSKFHDYFTSCLPSPQKGSNIELTIGGKLGLKADPSNYYNLGSSMQMGSTALSGVQTNSVFGATSSGNVNIKEIGFADPDYGAVYDTGKAVDITNLYVDSAELQNVSVNDLRYALALQRMLELDARGGTRYIEYLYSHFGVVSPDGRLQIPEYLTGSRTPINIQQVASTTYSSNASYVGDDYVGALGAYSLSNGKAKFSKSFTEHGFVIGVMCMRYKHSYQQGVERFWSRTKRTDFYDPIFANIGEQPVYTREIYSSSYVGVEQVFGYNEAWADLRYRPNYITGEMRTYSPNAFGSAWHFGDEYTSAPYLSKEFIEETNKPVDRTLTVDSSELQNFIFDIFYKVDAIRELPLFSIPSITDGPIRR